MLALWPAFPYNLQLAAFIPTLLTPGFPPSVLTDVNLLLQLAFALLLARGLRGTEAASASPPAWPAMAAGLLLTTFLNPGFDPKIQFSAYGDPTIAIGVAFAAWQAERTLAALAQNQSAASERLALAFVLLAGVAIKQVSVFLIGSIVAVAFLIGAFDRRIGPRRALIALAPGLLPALLLLGVWRFYVAEHFAADDELRLLPFAQWSFTNIPAILVSMATQIWGRAPFFALLYGVSLSAIPVALRRGLTPGARLFLLTLGVTLLYTVFLIFTYVAHFPGAIGASAHSFFRYNMHLGLLATLAAVTFARESWIRRGAPDLGRGWRAIAIGAVVLAFAAPLLTAGWVRYDDREPEPLVWSLARFAAPHLGQGAHVALLLPGDNRSVALMLRVALSISNPRQPLVNFDDSPHADPEALNRALSAGDDYALISCVPADLASSTIGKALKLPVGQAALLSRDGDAWKLLAAHSYPPDMPPVRRWTAELSPGPFCR